MLNKVQKVAFQFIQSDARFLYTLVDMQNHAIEGNYLSMCLPYIGIFAHESEQWGRKAKIESPNFTKDEKEYYTKIRQAHKLLELSYEEYEAKIIGQLKKSDEYFCSVRSVIEKIFGYRNMGTDYYQSSFCGNTILIASYLPFDYLKDLDSGKEIYIFSKSAGKLAAFYMDSSISAYHYGDTKIKYKDYHFYDKCPLKLKNNLGLVLFCILCSINYVTIFIDRCITEETPQKFKYAYLQYYYLCQFIHELNQCNNTKFYINDSLCDRALRNCFAHYGLGQLLKEEDIIEEDILKGLTQKVFDMDYFSCKEKLYEYLEDFKKQIEEMIF